MQFANNKYTRWYNNIVTQAQNRKLSNEVYIEKHHIVPKSLGGSNGKKNIVELTAKEHFICHRLLPYMVETKKHRYQMWNALSCMMYRSRPGQARIKLTSRKIEHLKKEIAKQKSIKMSGSNNPMYNKNHTKESKIKMSQSQEKRHSEFPVTNETKEKLRVARKHTGPNYKLRGKNNANFKPGVREKSSQTFMLKYGVSNAAQIPKTCKYCGKTIGIANYKRWHGDNCKQKIFTEEK